MPNVNYTAITALVNKKYIPGIQDNFFRSNPLLEILLKGGNYETFDGHSVVQRLEYGELTGGVGWIRGDNLTASTTIPVTAAEWPIRYMVFPFVINKADEIETTGSIEAIEKALDTKIKNLKKATNKLFSNWLFTSTGAGGDAKKIHGFPALFHLQNVYGGIDRATADPDAQAYWRPIIDSSVNTRPLTERLMTKMWTSVAIDGDSPKLIITTAAIWNRYHEIAISKDVNSDTGKRLVSIGHSVLEFMGVPVTYDYQCPSGHMYFLNTDYLFLRYNPAANFWFDEFETDGMDKKSKLVWAGNLTCSECRKQGLISNIDEAGY